MKSSTVNQTFVRIEAVFGAGLEWRSRTGASATAWEAPAYHLLWSNDSENEVELRKLWQARKGRQAYSVILLAPSDDISKIRVVGPQDARPVRELPAGSVLALLETARGKPPREAASLLAREFARLEEAVLPGLRVKDLLTPHFLRDRLRQPAHECRLSSAVESLGHIAGLAWRSLFMGMGYQIEQLPKRGYLLRHDSAPVAVVHPFRDTAQFSRLTDNGELPEGLVLVDCDHYGAYWGILAAQGRYRLFQRRPPIGPATGQHLELDLGELQGEDRLYIGLLSPDSLKESGWLTKWIDEAKDFGEELRKGLEERLIKEALPNIARGLGEHLEAKGVDLSDRDKIQQIEAAALTLVFRFMFLLHTEARGYLPIGTAAYRPHSARQLAEDSRLPPSSFSRKATHRWDRLKTLVRMIRTGDRTTGVPAYNGSLFSAAGFPGSDMLERAEITDVHLAPALVAIAYETDKPDAPGLDYAGLQIGHLGAIYEALLTLRLTRAPEDLTYDTRRDVFRPIQDSEQPEVTKAQLYYQAETGGRKAGGVFYTRHEFVDHLLNHSLAPALNDHLKEVGKISDRNPGDAARLLFDFYVVDPAMGSAHFLTAALGMMADRIEFFLAEIGGLPEIVCQLHELTVGNDPGTSQIEDGDLLRRLILKRCIYGVDLSPMAVEVANITLWLASFVPGLALSFLGSNLKCGNALIGVADPLVVGSSDSSLLTGQPVHVAMKEAARLQIEQAAIPDRTPEEVNQSEELSIERDKVTAGLRTVFNLWTAEPLGLDGARNQLKTYAAVIVQSDGEHAAEVVETIARASDIATQNRFFHWPLEFPSVFHRHRPGFDVVTGNPPWNKVKFEMPNFLALHDPGIRGLHSGLARDKRAERLFHHKPELLREIQEIKKQVEEQRQFYRPENGYSIQGGGDTDLYMLFCERYASIARKEGFLGVVLPRVAFLNDGSREFRRWLFRECCPNRIDSILNSGRWAFDMEGRYTIALTSAQVGFPVSGSITTTGPASNEQEFEECITGEGVQVYLDSLSSWTSTPAVAKVKEPTWELPLLPSSEHVSVLSKMRSGVRFDDLQPPGGRNKIKGRAAGPSPVLYTELHSALQRDLFTNPPGVGRIPVLKGQSLHQYKPDWGEPAGYGKLTEIENFLLGKYSANPICLDGYQQGRVVFRRLTRSTDSRTTIACLVPPKTPLTDAIACVAFASRNDRKEVWKPLEKTYVLGILNSLPFDWLARRYVETTFNHFIMNAMSFPEFGDTDWQRIGALAARLSCIDSRFVEFAKKAGVEYDPLTDTESNDIRAEIDALVTHAYCLSTEELCFIFTDFTENAVSPAYRELVLEKYKNL